ncbi:MAG TPA: aminotransferase class I/II-fold pyridoxal phosphate-dependent enzyme [Candidatus Dormibacteraeota bacterium]|nr:aminotransferase class I/II-fold pyridoxal phosphate-dependent enzyme [Candidatus Dormibacteraeota bacterium]
MNLNRRNLLKQLGAGIAASSVLSPRRTSAAEISESASDPSVAPQHLELIRLDRNENAYGASPKAIAAMKEAATGTSRYQDSSVFLKTLADHHSETTSGVKQSIKPEQIVVGCGSSDVLRMAASAFLNPGATLILATPTCDLIAQYGRSRGATITEIPLRHDHAHDLEAMLKHANKSGASGLIYVCNPNSPTGTLTTRKDLEEFLVKISPKFHVVIDEAYHHYAGGSGAYLSFIDRPSDHPRVIVTRTFSTAYGLAGARVGYAVSSTSAAEGMVREALPFALNRAGMFAASAALADREYIETCTNRNFNDRQEFMNQVNARMLRALDSHANFVCLNVMRTAVEISEHYSKNNFVLAPLIPSMSNYLRISLGTPPEMREFWRVWDLLGSHPMSM